MILRVAFTNANGTITLVSAANPLPVTGGGGGGGGGAVTVADGADIALGATTDATTLWDGTSAATAIKLLATSTAATTASATDVDGIANVVGGITDLAYGGSDATIAAMLRAIADAAISQDPAVTKGAPVASYKSSAVDETEDLVSSSPCTINDLFLYNPGSATGHFKIYDAADVADVVVGSTVPIRTYPLGAGKAMHPTGLNIGCNNGVVIAATLNYADSDATAPQTDMIVNIGYRA